MAGRHHIEHLLQDCDGEQKLRSIKSYIQNLDQKEVREDCTSGSHSRECVATYIVHKESSNLHCEL
jgi:hypothetical protein